MCHLHASYIIVGMQCVCSLCICCIYNEPLGYRRAGCVGGRAQCCCKSIEPGCREWLYQSGMWLDTRNDYEVVHSAVVYEKNVK